MPALEPLLPATRFHLECGWLIVKDLPQTLVIALNLGQHVLGEVVHQSDAGDQVA